MKDLQEQQDLLQQHASGAFCETELEIDGQLEELTRHAEAS